MRTIHVSSFILRIPPVYPEIRFFRKKLQNGFSTKNISGTYPSGNHWSICIYHVYSIFSRVWIRLSLVGACSGETLGDWAPVVNCDQLARRLDRARELGCDDIVIHEIAMHRVFNLHPYDHGSLSLNQYSGSTFLCFRHMKTEWGWCGMVVVTVIKIPDCI